MTNYADALALLVSGKQGRAARIEKSMARLDRTEAEATIIEDAVVQAIREGMRAVGVAIDSVSTFDSMQADVVAILCVMLPQNAESVAAYMLAASIGALPITPGCSCDSCRTMKGLEAQVILTQGERQP